LSSYRWEGGQGDKGDRVTIIYWFEAGNEREDFETAVDKGGEVKNIS